VGRATSVVSVRPDRDWGRAGPHRERSPLGLRSRGSGARSSDACHLAHPRSEDPDGVRRALAEDVEPIVTDSIVVLLELDMTRFESNVEEIALAIVQLRGRQEAYE